MRLDKYLTACGACTRSEAKKLIKSGAVTVDGAVCKDAAAKITEADTVSLDGRTLEYREHVYLMLNKPAGYISAVEDKHSPVVTDLVPAEYAHFGVYPVGRLDLDTEGLLLLTNDGDFSHELTSPKKNVAKRYFARLSEPADESDRAAFARGMEFKDFTAKPARLEITADPHEVYIEITEGKFHQVKRMCERVGKTVTYLKRVGIGSLALDETLKKGEVRELTAEELALVAQTKKAFSN